MSEGLTEALCDRLLRAELDIAIVTAPQPNDHLDYETLVIEQVFLIGPPRDPLLQKGRLTRREFNAYRPRSCPSAAIRFRKAPVFAARRWRNADETDCCSRPWLWIAALLRHPPGSHRRDPVGRARSWLRADRVIALPRGRPTSRATREVVAALKDICRDMILKGVILTAAARSQPAWAG